jgi:predicted transcriptional regulator
MVEVLVSLDDALAARLDEQAGKRGVSRSDLLREFVEQGLGVGRGPGNHPDVHRALAELDEMFKSERGADWTRLIREERDSH